MLVSSYTVQLLHEDRLRDAERRRSSDKLLRDATEQAPVVVYTSLWQQLKQRFSPKTQRQGAADVRRVHAV